MTMDILNFVLNLALGVLFGVIILMLTKIVIDSIDSRRLCDGHLRHKWGKWEVEFMEEDGIRAGLRHCKRCRKTVGFYTTNGLRGEIWVRFRVWLRGK